MGGAEVSREYYCGFKSAQTVPFKELYIDQYVDHFNFVSYGESIFKERYLLQDQWWKPGVGPIFFYTGNEGSIEEFWDNTGFVFDIAPEFNALVVFAEHMPCKKRLRSSSQPGKLPAQQTQQHDKQQAGSEPRLLDINTHNQHDFDTLLE
uniref:Uncharacterized protein n=1 Tax=Magallana gigas TaxID=29159 RepID=A0A8W8KV34_MAGGI